MPILSNNSKAQPYKIRVENARLEKRAVTPEGRAIVNHEPAAVMPQPSTRSNSACDVKARNTKKVPPLEPKYTISSDDWAVWEPIFVHARDKLGVEFGSKTQLELHMDTDKRHDGYKHWTCSLRPRGKGALRLKFSLRSSGDGAQEFGLLAIMFVKESAARLVTRTSIAHNARVGCSPWTRFSVPDCAVQPCCDALCRDVSGDGDISLYEQGLLVAQRDLELEALRARMIEDRAATEEAQSQHIKAARVLKRTVEDMEKANRRLAQRCAELAADNRDLKTELEALRRDGGEGPESDDEFDEPLRLQKAASAKRRRVG